MTPLMQVFSGDSSTTIIWRANSLAWRLNAAGGEPRRFESSSLSSCIDNKEANREYTLSTCSLLVYQLLTKILSRSGGLYAAVN